MFIFGTRPEAIKMAPVIIEFKKRITGFEPIVCVTAQHRQMLDQVLRIFEISPEYDLNTMKEGQDLFDITAGTLLRLRKILLDEKPDLILVQGDTTSAFAGGLAAYYLRIPVGHIEAGLRTYDKYSPFPEEVNRRLLSGLSDLHFAPTEWAKANLMKEGVFPQNIWVTGNTVIDALLMISENHKVNMDGDRWRDYFQSLQLLADEWGSRKKVILVTGHRRENFGRGFEEICRALRDVAEQREDVIIVYPVHLNPNVRKPVERLLSGLRNVHLVAPLDYEPFVWLMSKSYLIVTDSGGVQEEAPSLGKPVLVIRDTTERPEGVEAGTVKVIGTIREHIVDNISHLLDNKKEYDVMARASNPYGDGEAAKRIVDVISSRFH